MPRKHRILAALRAAFPVSMPVLAGYLFLGAGYGVLMHSLGYGPGWTAAFSITVFGGTIQYVATQILAAQYAPVHALVISLILNARHLFYGFSMLGRYGGRGGKSRSLSSGSPMKPFPWSATTTSRPALTRGGTGCLFPASIMCIG